MSDDLQQRADNHEFLSLPQILYLSFTFAGIVLILNYIFTTLNFFFGVDYRMFCLWYKKYTETGSLYHENTVFFNFPLAVLAFGPWHFLSGFAPVAMKFLQTFFSGIISFFLLFKIAGKDLIKKRDLFFCFLLLVLSFFVIQLAYLNIYAEVLALLLFSLFFHGKRKEWLSAFCLSFAILFKIFLAPLVLASFLAGEYRLFLKVLASLVVLLFASVFVFGLQAHIDMLAAMTKTYTRMRMFGLNFPYIADGFSGYQDILNKLVNAGFLSQKTVVPFTMILGLFYGCVVFYVFYLIFSVTRAQGKREFTYYSVFATVLVFSLGFNFRYDHGLLLLTVLPFLILVSPERTGFFKISMIFIVLLRFGVEMVLKISGFAGIASVLGTIASYLTFHFIGINLLVWYFASYWIRLQQRGI